MSSSYAAIGAVAIGAVAMVTMAMFSGSNDVPEAEVNQGRWFVGESNPSFDSGEGSEAYWYHAEQGDEGNTSYYDTPQTHARPMPASVTTHVPPQVESHLSNAQSYTPPAQTPASGPAHEHPVSNYVQKEELPASHQQQHASAPAIDYDERTTASPISDHTDRKGALGEPLADHAQPVDSVRPEEDAVPVTHPDRDYATARVASPKEGSNSIDEMSKQVSVLQSLRERESGEGDNADKEHNLSLARTGSAQDPEPFPLSRQEPAKALFLSDPAPSPAPESSSLDASDESLIPAKHSAPDSDSEEIASSNESGDESVLQTSPVEIERVDDAAQRTVDPAFSHVATDHISEVEGPVSTPSPVSMSAHDTDVAPALRKFENTGPVLQTSPVEIEWADSPAQRTLSGEDAPSTIEQATNTALSSKEEGASTPSATGTHDEPVPGQFNSVEQHFLAPSEEIGNIVSPAERRDESALEDVIPQSTVDQAQAQSTAVPSTQGEHLEEAPENDFGAQEVHVQDEEEVEVMSATPTESSAQSSTTNPAPGKYNPNSELHFRAQPDPKYMDYCGSHCVAYTSKQDATMHMFTTWSVIKNLVSGNMHRRDLRAVAAISKMVYKDYLPTLLREIDRDYDADSWPQLQFVHRHSNSKGAREIMAMADLRQMYKTAQKARGGSHPSYADIMSHYDSAWPRSGVPRIVMFWFPLNGRIIAVYSIAGTDTISYTKSDERTDFSFNAFARGTLRQIPRAHTIEPSRDNQMHVGSKFTNGLVIKKKSSTRKNILPHHNGFCSYGGNAFDLVKSHLEATFGGNGKAANGQPKPPAPDEVWVYGHSLGGASALIVSHALRHTYDVKMGADPLDIHVELDPGDPYGARFGGGPATQDEPLASKDPVEQTAIAEFAQRAEENIEMLGDGLNEADQLPGSPDIHCMAFAAPSYVQGTSFMSKSADEVESSPNFSVMNIINHGDGVIYNYWTTWWNCDYPGRAIAEENKVVDQYGVTCFGLLDARNDAKYPCNRKHLDVLSSELALFTHGHFMDADGNICVENGELRKVRDLLRTLGFNVMVNQDLASHALLAPKCRTRQQGIPIDASAPGRIVPRPEPSREMQLAARTQIPLSWGLPSSSARTAKCGNQCVPQVLGVPDATLHMFDTWTLVKRLVDGTIERDDLRTIAAITKMGYSDMLPYVMQKVHNDTKAASYPPLTFLHRNPGGDAGSMMSIDLSDCFRSFYRTHTYAPSMTQMLQQGHKKWPSKGSPRIITFHFDRYAPSGDKETVFVFSIVGTDTWNDAGDQQADISNNKFTRRLFIKGLLGKGIDRGYSAVPDGDGTIQTGSDSASKTFVRTAYSLFGNEDRSKRVAYHSGFCSYGGRAFQFIKQHLANKKAEGVVPSQVWLYGHSLGGASSLIVSHCLKHMYDISMSVGYDVELAIEDSSDTVMELGEALSVPHDESMEGGFFPIPQWMRRSKRPSLESVDPMLAQSSPQHAHTSVPLQTVRPSAALDVSKAPSELPQIHCMAFAAPSYVRGRSLLSLTKADQEELGGMFSTLNVINRGDGVIYNWATSGWNMTYPVASRDVGKGGKTAVNEGGITCFGILDSRNQPTYRSDRYGLKLRLLEGNVSAAVMGDQLDGEQALFVHSNYMDRSGNMCVDERILSSAHKELRMLGFRSVKVAKDMPGYLEPNSCLK